MTLKYKDWQRFFLFCLGLFLGTAFCMKWMEGDFLQNGEKFTIIGLEMSYQKNEVMSILSGLDNPVKTILRYHLVFDFVFMAGVYPGIAALCMMSREKVTAYGLKMLFFGVAVLQLFAWGCDIAENLYLLKWISQPVIGKEFGLYHLIVATKWIIALAGALLCLSFLLWPKKSGAAG